MNLIDLTVQKFIAKLASPTEGPGGGSASAFIGLSGIALLQMAAGRACSSFNQQELAAIAKQLTELIDEDQRAFAVVVALQPQSNKQHQSFDAQLEQAVTYAIEIPLTIVKDCIAGIVIAQQAITIIDSSMRSELLVAVEALRAGAASSLINMTVNLSLLQSVETAASYVHLIEQYRKQLEQLLATIYRQTDIVKLLAT